MTFHDQLTAHPPDLVQHWLDGATPAHIERALQRPRLEMSDFAALLNPAISDHHLEQLARRAQRLTRQRFGRVMLLYAPLYLSNACANGCRYCGFSADNQLYRRTLSHDEIAREARLLREQGFRHMLLLTGEDLQTVGIAYLEKAVEIIRHYCGSVSIEVFPMGREGYQRMVAAGVDGLTLYQETYDRELYQQLHPYGPKRDYLYRLEAPERAGQAGLRRIGIGCLLGLADSLTDIFYTGLHALYLARSYWRSQVSVSFPRLRPAAGGFRPAKVISDRQLTQFIAAMRLLIPDAGLVLSTREDAALRNHLLHLGITQMSAGSCTAPGGYGDKNHDNGQFTVSDERGPREIENLLRQQGFDPVWKDWDGAFLSSTG